jgi:hypothetical protein
MLWLQYSLDNWLTDGGEFASLARRQRVTPQSDIFFFVIS